MVWAQFLRGWSGYFRYGNSAPDIRRDQAVRPGTAGRVRGQAPQTQPALGHAPVTCGSPDNPGLIPLCGTVIAPRPFHSGPGGRRPDAGRG